MYVMFLLRCYDLIFKLIPCAVIMPSGILAPKLNMDIQQMPPTSNSKNKDGQQVQGKKKIFPLCYFDFMIDFSLESLSYIPYGALFLGPQQNLETPFESSPPS